MTEIFEANYTNNSGDDFKILILSELSHNKEFISAYADLSYKDVDNILEPIRGAQLDININASITKPFDLFLDFEEGDFKAELYRNGIKLFEGFINPEGVTQDFTSEFWVCRLTAVDNLASLKNKNLKYTNELPSEFVLMDLCLKETGLDLPIAFFDDINYKVTTENGANLNYGKLLANGDRERIVDPLVFKNDNGRFVSCDEVLQDILNKYNAVLFQHNITNNNVSRLCWVFIRPALFYRGFSDFAGKEYPISEITGYTTQTINGFQNIKVPIINELARVNPQTFFVGRKDNPLTDSYYKNSNQLIRQSRALQNFRFIQNWIDKKTLLKYTNQNFIKLPNTLYDLGGFEDDKLFFWTHFAFAQLWESIDFTLPPDASDLNINGFGDLIRNTNRVLFYSFIKLSVKIEHTAPSGNKYKLEAVEENGNVVSVTWIDINETSNNVAVELFDIKGVIYDKVEVKIDFNLPQLVEPGGTFKVFLPSLKFDKTLSDPVGYEEKQIKYLLKTFNVKAIPPESLGKGEFHDALNLQKISSKLDDPIEVINADESTNFFRNGLKTLPNNANLDPTNYSYWTTDYDKNQFNNIKLLEIMSKERIRLFAKSQNIFSGDFGNYVPYIGRIKNEAYENIFFMFTKWIYRTAENTIETEMREIGINNPSVNYENSIIFDDEENRLIE